MLVCLIGCKKEEPKQALKPAPPLVVEQKSDNKRVTMRRSGKTGPWHIYSVFPAP